MLLQVLNLIGVAAFAVSGALIGVRRELDVFGVCVVGVTTGIGGGIIRDVLLGIHPPMSMERWPNVAVSAAVSLIVFVAHTAFSKLWGGVVLFDAFGMGLFAASGAGFAIQHDAAGLAAVMIGATTAIGGGVVRDVLVNEVPLLLHRDLYALPALLGALLMVIFSDLGISYNVALVVGTIAATGLRLVALWQRWNLPKARA
jgi:uncharacterized membrane protein YeiH